MRNFSRLPREPRHLPKEPEKISAPEEAEEKVKQTEQEKSYEPSALLYAAMLANGPEKAKKMIESLRPYLSEKAQKEIGDALQCTEELRACEGQPEPQKQIRRLKVVSRCLKSGQSAKMLQNLERGLHLRSVMERAQKGDPFSALSELLPMMGGIEQLMGLLGGETKSGAGGMDPTLLMNLMGQMKRKN